MGLSFDPEFYKAIEPQLDAMSKIQKPPVHDVESRRIKVQNTFGPLFNAISVPPHVDIKIYYAKAKDGTSVPIYHYFKKDARTKYIHGSVPAIYHIHGGGFISLKAGNYNNVVAALAASTGVQVFSVDYRLAPENPFPTPIEDCYAGLVWLHEHATEFHVDRSRIAVYGDSSGGGLAASLAIMARDRELSPPLAKQVLLAPMIDDRSLKPSPDDDLLFWNSQDNITAWTAYVGKNAGQDGVSPYAAAARIENMEGLPPTYIDVGTLDLFQDEVKEYAARLKAAKVKVEFNLYQGVPHGFEYMARGTDLVKNVQTNRVRALKSF